MDEEIKIRTNDNPVLSFRTNENPVLSFSLENQWIVKLTKKGFEFNHADYPELTASDFARDFIEILERCGYIYKPQP